MEHQLFREAEQAVQRGDRDSAYHLIRQTLIHDPSYVPAWLELSKLIDDLPRQRECLERALKLDPTNTLARDSLECLRLRQLLASNHAPVARAAEPQKLGAYIVEQGILTADQVEEALWDQRQRRRRGDLIPLGDILLQRGWLTPRALARILVAQQQEKFRRWSRPTPRFLGEYLVMEKIITPLQLEAALEEQARLRLESRQVPLGIILMRHNALSLETLKQVLMRQEAERFNSFAE